MFRINTFRLSIGSVKVSLQTIAFQPSRHYSQTRPRIMAPLPIVVCGKHPSIAASVRKGLLPEYDVIHVVLSVEAGISDIPLLLSSQAPRNSSSNLGSQNYTKPPVAIALGGGFDSEMFEKMKNACDNAPSSPWLRTDTSKGPGPPGPEEQESYGAIVAQRMKKRLGELKVGEEGGVREGVFWF